MDKTLNLPKGFTLSLHQQQALAQVRGPSSQALCLQLMRTGAQLMAQGLSGPQCHSERDRHTSSRLEVGLCSQKRPELWKHGFRVSRRW